MVDCAACGSRERGLSTCLLPRFPGWVLGVGRLLTELRDTQGSRADFEIGMCWGAGSQVLMGQFRRRALGEGGRGTWSSEARFLLGGELNSPGQGDD